MIIFGAPGDRPLAGDWNGDGRDEPGVLDPGTQTFYFRTSGLDPAETTESIRYGDPGDRPVIGDWDGNRTSTQGVLKS